MILIIWAMCSYRYSDVKDVYVIIMTFYEDITIGLSYIQKSSDFQIGVCNLTILDYEWFKYLHNLPLQRDH